MDGRVCSKCGAWKPAGDYYKDKRAKDGLYSSCKACFRKTLSASAKKNAASKRAYLRKYRAANPEKVRAWARDERLRDPERYKAKQRKYREANKPKISSYNRKHYEQNREYHRARAAQWRADNPEKHAAQYDPAKWRKYGRDYRARKLNAFVEDVLEDDLILRDEGRCGICEQPIMGPLEIDHIIPLSRQGTHEPDNCQIAHKTCNRRKHARIDYKHAA